jgi:hypothetical protein
MAESRLDLLKYAASQFVSGKALDVDEDQKSLSFRFGTKAVTVSLDEDEDGFTVFVGDEYEGTVCLRVAFKKSVVDDQDYNYLLFEEVEYVMSDGKRHPMPPGPAYSLLALGIVVADVAGYHLYGTLCSLEDSIKTARRLLGKINDSAEVPKLRNWQDNPKFLDHVLESYVYLIT